MNVAVVLPIYKSRLKTYEKLSLLSLKKQLSKKYEIYIITHKELTDFITKHPLLKKYKLIYFPKRFFTYQGYNSLLKSLPFYLAFKQFEYILIYQTDCLIFNNQLDYWLKKGYDYIGAPWFVKDKKNNYQFIGVGNGGFSLRKVSSFIKVLNNYKNFRIKLKIFLKNIFPSLRILLYKLCINRDYPKYHLGCRNEDVFWSFAAKQIVPSFRVASYSDALKFSFEKYPSFCFKENKNKLPLGCHGFQKYERKFWARFITKAIRRSSSTSLR
ncbi:MAG: DUF5672 family protein [Candidatus Aenigmatarchaeota archaeon]